MKKLLIVAVGLGLLFLGIIIGQSNTGNPTSTQEAKKPIDPTLQEICSRESPYSLEPRFQRALSLIGERTDFNSGKAKSIMVGIFYPSIKNCLDVSYCPENQMQGAEGLFYFSEKISSKDKYKICVSNNYVQEDDLLTSVVLVHEITHAIQLAVEKAGGRTMEVDCFDLEAEAFSEEVYYATSLTQGELESLLTRTDLHGTQSPQVADLRNVVTRSVKLLRGDDIVSWIPAVRADMKKYVSSNPYYQKQCAL